jgi:hypothetical protein
MIVDREWSVQPGGRGWGADEGEETTARPGDGARRGRDPSVRATGGDCLLA